MERHTTLPRKKPAYTWVFQLLTAAFFVSGIFLQNQWNSILLNAWVHAKQNPIFMYETFEAVFTVFFSFVFSFAFLDWCKFSGYFDHCRLPDIYFGNQLPPRPKEPMSFLRCIVRIFQYKNTYELILYYYIPILVKDYFIQVRPGQIARAQDPTFFLLVWDVFKTLVTYDFYFYCCHRAMHNSGGFIYGMFHKRHHVPGIKTPCEVHSTFELGPFQTWVNTACSIAAVNSFGAHPFARLIYNCITIFWLVSEHSEYSFPWDWQNIIPVNLTAGSMMHQLHHSYPNCGNFAKWFTWCDYIGGTLADEGEILRAFFRTNKPADLTRVTYSKEDESKNGKENKKLIPSRE